MRVAVGPLIEAVAARTAERGAGTRPRDQPVTDSRASSVRLLDLGPEEPIHPPWELFAGFTLVIR
jgi:hypothetical protein